MAQAKELDKITFRFCENKDIKSVVELLQIGLGNTKIPKTEEYWNWKHNQNPFGKSFILLACDENKIIGVRAFMQWKFINKDKRLFAVRAVDTVTHPEYQGLGIFKKLTLTLVDELSKKNISIVYNTPNQKSKPGYLKMGWKIYGKSTLKIKFQNLLFILLYKIQKVNFLKVSIKQDHSCKEFFFDSQIENVIQNNKQKNQDYFCTDYSLEYLKWRYFDLPVFDYGQINDKSNWILFFRLKRTKGLNELRITDFFVHEDFEQFKDLKVQLQKLLKTYKADLITVSGENGFVFNKILPKLGFFNIGQKGIEITLRELNLNHENINDREKWGWTAGDLELF
jgi:GNAT superfamily N-acetyltransferase